MHPNAIHILFLLSIAVIDVTTLLISPSDFNLVQFIGEDGPNISPFFFNCDNDSDGSWHHSLLGTFSRDPEKYCSSDCNRHLACCRPQHPDKMDVQFLLTTHDGQNFAGRFDEFLFDTFLRDNDQPIALFVHGFTNNYLQTPQFNETQKLYVDAGFNFVIVDWHIANSVYAQAVYNTRTVGAMIAYFLNKYDMQSRAICIGFSLGSHVCGEAGKWLKAKNNKPLAKCHMLDPAGPFFDGCGEDARQSKDDCTVVVVYHVSQNVSEFLPINPILKAYGSKQASGNCDFWINDGLSWKQPGCGCVRHASVQPYFVQSRVMNRIYHCVWCAHFRVLDFYLSEVNRSCRRIGVESENCGNVTECVPMPDGRKMFLPPNDACDSSMRIDFKVITTQKEAPFC